MNTTPPRELAKVVKSSRARAKDLPERALASLADGSCDPRWGERVDAWLVARGFSILPELSDDELAEIREVFRLLDDDDSGALDAEELLEGFGVVGTRHEGELKALIASVDFDGSGLIELDEFEVIMSSKKQFAKLRGAMAESERGARAKDGGGGVGGEEEEEEDDDGGGGGGGGGFDANWARGLRRKKLLDALREGGEKRERLARLAAEAERAANDVARFESRAAREIEELRGSGAAEAEAGEEERAAMRAVLSASRDAMKAAGLPPVPYAYLRDKGSGKAALKAIRAALVNEEAKARARDAAGKRGVGKRDERNEAAAAPAAAAEEEEEEEEEDARAAGSPTPDETRVVVVDIVDDDATTTAMGRTTSSLVSTRDWSKVASRVGDVGRRKKTSPAPPPRAALASRLVHSGRVDARDATRATSAMRAMRATSDAARPSRRGFTRRSKAADTRARLDRCLGGASTAAATFRAPRVDVDVGGSSSYGLCSLVDDV